MPKFNWLLLAGASDNRRTPEHLQDAALACPVGLQQRAGADAARVYEGGVFAAR